MHAVAALAAGVNVRDLRQSLLGAGMECSAADCVPWDELPLRLSQVQEDIVVFRLAAGAAPNWRVLQETRSLSMAPLVVIGPNQSDLVEQSRQLGVAEYVDEAALPGSLDEALGRLTASGAVRRPRGTLISVYSPTAGSGATTVACNLAGALAEKRPKDVALIEVSPEAGDIAVLLDITPLHTMEDVSRRWQSLDPLGLANSVFLHKSGIKALVNPIEQRRNDLLTPDVIRRLSVLAKMSFSATVLALESRLSELELEAMRLADHILLVVRPDVPSVRRAQIAIQEADGHGIALERFQLVVNRWGQSGQLKIQQVESSLGLKCLQLIPDDSGKVNRAMNKGVLLRELARHSTIYRRFAALAAHLEGRGASKSKAWSWA